MFNNTLDKKKEKQLVEENQLSSLVDMNSPYAVHDEVITILNLIDSLPDWKEIDNLFHYTENLYKGYHPQYKACNTEYHNFRHITDTYLAMARLIHGASIEGESFSEREIILSIAAALLHDTGMIQHKDDMAATGAEYVKEHVQRSMEFVKNHSLELAINDSEIKDINQMILCTDLAVDFATIGFSSMAIERLGKLLGTADLLGQMADRTYLEKLLFLFHEFREADVGECENEIDFLHQTLEFYKLCDYRYEKILDGTYRLMIPHFRNRWDIQANLYLEALNRQRDFLKDILADPKNSPYHHLKRSGIVSDVRRKYGELGLKNRKKS